MRWLTAVTVAGAVAMSGCSDGMPPPGRSESSMDIPVVADPLDVSAFVDDPCALLDGSQRAELALPVTETIDMAGVTCELRASEGDGPAVEVEVVPHGGLEWQYDHCRPELESEDCAAWTTDIVGGYPVLRAPVGDAAMALCRIFVGVADDQTIEIFDARPVRGGRGPDCETADRLAVLVLDSLAG